jgi:hypothetical protein
MPTAGGTQTALLGSTSASSTDLTTTFAVDKRANGTGGGVHHAGGTSGRDESGI